MSPPIEDGGWRYRDSVASLCGAVGGGWQRLHLSSAVNRLRQGLSQSALCTGRQTPRAIDARGPNAPAHSIAARGASNRHTEGQRKAGCRPRLSRNGIDIPRLRLRPPVARLAMGSISAALGQVAKLNIIKAARFLALSPAVNSCPGRLCPS
jgi:hypothetical protein